MSPKVTTQGSQDRRRRYQAAQATARTTLARVVRLVCVAMAVILALGALIVVLRADINVHNPIVRLVLQVADTVSGPFSRNNGVFHFTGKGAPSKNALLNWGIAALVWLVAGRLVARAIEPRGRR